MERTLGIVKPDAVAANRIGKIIERVEAEGLQVVGLRRLQLSMALAEGFYAVHRERPFFKSLTEFMTSGPVVVMALQGENAISRWRTLMGATNPAEADDNTLRKLYASDIEHNAVHGSDAPETAKEEIAYFFAQVDLAGSAQSG